MIVKSGSVMGGIVSTVEYRKAASLIIENFSIVAVPVLHRTLASDYFEPEGKHRNSFVLFIARMELRLCLWVSKELKLPNSAIQHVRKNKSTPFCSK